MTLADLPELRGAPDVDPRECIPSLAGKPHGHELLCLPWARGDFDRRETRTLQQQADTPRATR